MSMLASLTLSSDERLLSLVRAFGREFAAAAGLPDMEAAGLVGALDEAVRFVCERAYPGDPSGRIEVTLEPAERGIRAAVHDWGRPLTSAEGPAELAGLGATVEDLRLINLGAHGKRLSFVWPTVFLVDVAAGVADAPPPVAATMDAGEIAVRDARTEDAEPIAQLLYDNYALSYVHPDFYRPRWVDEELRAGRLLSTVAVHGGEIVGHHALLPPPGAQVAETGVAVVAPAYRGLGIFGRLSEHTLARARAFGLRAVYGRAVTMHPYSQRAELAHGYRETALCLAASPGEVTMRGVAAATRAGRRTALMISFLPLRSGRRRASLPERYRGCLLDTYDRLGLAAPAPAQMAAQAPDVVAVEREAEAEVAVITVGGWDDAVAARAIAAIRMLLAEHVDVIYADLDLEAIADPDAAVDALREQGFSYAGLWLHGPGDHDHLRLQRLNSTEVELDHIAAASPAGHDLVRYVLDDRDQVAAGRV
jgi:anti-sigma regulatory factor (Ser/Thr protein kinase)/N-acetylglutamate synthase-like GNAT family acetyltransferase